MSSTVAVIFAITWVVNNCTIRTELRLFRKTEPKLNRNSKIYSAHAYRQVWTLNTDGPILKQNWHKWSTGPNHQLWWLKVKGQGQTMPGTWCPNKNSSQRCFIITSITTGHFEFWWQIYFITWCLASFIHQSLVCKFYLRGHFLLGHLVGFLAYKCDDLRHRGVERWNWPTAM